jgi:hypothetical protein
MGSILALIVPLQYQHTFEVLRDRLLRVVQAESASRSVRPPMIRRMGITSPTVMMPERFGSRGLLPLMTGEPRTGDSRRQQRLPVRLSD